MMKPTGIAFLALVCFGFGLPTGASAQDSDGWAALGEPRTHILMRHAEAPGTGDPANFRLGDCSTQRNLSSAGREQARRIGQAISERGLSVGRVLTSQWCRASQTAAGLDLGPVVEEPALNSFFDDRDTADEQSEAVRQRLVALDAEGVRAVLVTHQVNITALTGVSPASGEMIVVQLVGNDLEARGRIVVEPGEADPADAVR